MDYDTRPRRQRVGRDNMRMTHERALTISQSVSITRRGQFRSTMSAAESSPLRKYNAGIVSLCVIGLGLSWYAYIVETKKEQDDSYQALCDISESISCTKVFMSEYGKGFGLFSKDSVFNIPNPIYGLAFYTQIAILSMTNNHSCSVAVVILGLLSNICTIWLAHILYMFKDVCVVCVSTYIVNGLIMFLAVIKLRSLANSRKKKIK